MKLRPFTFARARTVEEALSIWQESDLMFISGGQGLISEMGLGIRRPTHLLDVSNIPALAAIESTEEGMRLGAAVTIGYLTASTSIGPLLRQAARHVGVAPIRTLATVGGNFCHGNPTAELPLAACVAGAHIVGIARDGSPVRLGPSDWGQLRPPEDVSPVMITALEWPHSDNVASTGFVEIGVQATFVPETAIAWMAFRAADSGDSNGLRIGVAMREGGRFLMTAKGDGPLPDDVAAAMESAGIVTRLSSGWLSDIIRDAVSNASGSVADSVDVADREVAG